jgi:hypothetical protein
MHAVFKYVDSPASLAGSVSGSVTQYRRDAMKWPDLARGSQSAHENDSPTTGACPLSGILGRFALPFN